MKPPIKDTLSKGHIRNKPLYKEHTLRSQKFYFRPLFGGSNVYLLVGLEWILCTVVLTCLFILLPPCSPVCQTVAVYWCLQQFLESCGQTLSLSSPLSSLHTHIFPYQVSQYSVSACIFNPHPRVGSRRVIVVGLCVCVCVCLCVYVRPSRPHITLSLHCCLDTQGDNIVGIV